MWELGSNAVTGKASPRLCEQVYHYFEAPVINAARGIFKIAHPRNE